MKRSTQIRLLRSALLFSVLVCGASVAQAQVETIDPNPTMPRDVGGRLTYRGFSGGGFKLGRTSARDENPAETLLKSIDGTNYGRASGHSIFARKAAPRAPANTARRRPLSYDPLPATMPLSQRRAYENRAYEHARGTYRAAERKRTNGIQPSHGHPAGSSPSSMTERHASRAIAPPRATKNAVNNAN
jgi:hypothetical protein